MNDGTHFWSRTVKPGTCFGSGDFLIQAGFGKGTALAVPHKAFKSLWNPTFENRETWGIRLKRGIIELYLINAPSWGKLPQKSEVIYSM